MTAPAAPRRPLPDAQLDALLRGVLGAPTLGPAQRQRHLRRLLPAAAPRHVASHAPHVETDAARARPLPMPGHAAPRRRPGWLRQGLGFVGSLLALALVAGLLMAVFGAGSGQHPPGAIGSPNDAHQSYELIVPWDVNGDGRYKLFSVNADNGQLSKLTPGPAVDDPARESAAAISPDGTRVAFVSDRDGTPALYVMGATPLKIADGPLSLDAPPVWSPDGTRLLINTAGPPGDAGNIAVVNTDGSGRRQLTRLSAGAVWPSWSPDGARIAYVSIHGTGLAIWVMNADGSDAHAITDTPSPDITYQWSPDGQHIAYAISSGALYVIGADGQDARVLRDDGWEPRWSPDGSQIAFISGDFIADALDLFVMRADGSDVRQLTRQGGALSHLAWSPDGASLAYISGPRGGLATPEPGPGELRVVSASGADDRRVLRDVDLQARPVWRPAAADAVQPSAVPTPTSAVSAPNNVYVVTTSGVGAIDAATGQTLYTLPAPFSPDAVLSPDGTRLYIADLGDGGTLSAHDAATGDELWRVPLEDRINWIDGLGPPTVAIAPDGSRLIVARSTASEVQSFAIVDTSDGAVIGNSQPLVGYCPALLHVSSDIGTLYAACLRGGLVRTIDMGTLAGGPQITVDGTIVGSAASTDGDTLFVVSLTTDGFQVTVIDTNRRVVLHQTQVRSDGWPPRLRQQVALSPDGTRLFVGVGEGNATGDDVQYSDDIAVVDTSNWLVIARIHSDWRLTGQGLAVLDDGSVYGIAQAEGSRPDALGAVVVRFDVATREASVFATHSSDVLRILVPTVASSAPATEAPPTGEIAFVSDRDGNDELYLVDADGSHERRLTRSPAPDADPRWSPDGAHLAFTRGTDGERDIYVMDADGSNVRDVTNLGGDDIQPAWSPDGRTIAFAHRAPGAGGRFQIYAVGLDGAPPRNLSGQPGADERPSDDQTPAWSPDGATIAYGRQGAPTPQIWLMDAGGSHQRALTSNPDTPDPDVAMAPRWSPDGRRIVYRLLTDQWRSVIVNADGSGQRPIGSDELSESVEWSVNGAGLIAVGASPQGLAFYALDPDDPSTPRQLFDTAQLHIVFDQSPDGRWLAYTSDAGVGPPGATTVLQVASLTGDITQITTTHIAPGSSVAWRPAGSR